MRKTVTRVLIGLVVVVVVVIALLGGIIGLEGAQGAGRLEAIINTRIANPNGPEIRAYVARPKQAGPYPAVIMIHEFWGLNPEIIGKAEALAQEGYVVIAPDVFRGSTTSQIPRAIYQVVVTPAEQVNTDLDAVFAWLITQKDVKADRIGIIGFCFGGRSSLLYSLSNNKLAATAVLYGNPVTEAARLKSLSGPVLGIYGSADSSISVESVKQFEAALKEAGVKNQISIYENQPHAFVKSVEEIKKDPVQNKAWNEVLTFFKQSLQGEKTSLRPVTPARANDPFPLDYLVLLAFEHSVLGSTHGH